MAHGAIDRAGGCSDRFEIPSWLETVLWVLNDAICPVVIVYSSRVSALRRSVSAAGHP